MAQADVVIVGGGHNGLVAASYLAKGGLRTLVLERRSRAGGLLATEEIAPGDPVLLPGVDDRVEHLVARMQSHQDLRRLRQALFLQRSAQQAQHVIVMGVQFARRRGERDP